MPLLYRDGVWLLDGEPVNQDGIAEYRDALADQWAAALGQIAIAELGINAPRAAIEFPLGRIERFGVRFLGRIADMIASAYVVARGGVVAVPTEGWARVVTKISTQEAYARGFMDALRSGGVSQAQAVARARSYSGTVVDAFSVGMADQVGVSLPSHPGDGSQKCRGRCRCSWTIAEFDDRWEATWRLNASAEHCSSCLDNAARWSPLVRHKKKG